MIKRIFDFFLSLVGLFIFVPIWVLIVYAIILEDGRPVFFVQERVGRNCIRFKVIKFRTMKVTGSPHLISDYLENDTRITRVGRVLRATAMDELPQLINILEGEMSFVGPRPLPYVRDDDVDIDQVPGFATRIKASPGLTGLAQIYARKSASNREKFIFDISYVEKQSLLLDLKLIMLSFLVTLKGSWEINKRKM